MLDLRRQAAVAKQQTDIEQITRMLPVERRADFAAVKLAAGHQLRFDEGLEFFLHRVRACHDTRRN